METANDKIVIVNLEHAYALSGIIKTEEPEEVMITDEIVIKSEETDEIVIKSEETNENDMAIEEVTVKTELPEYEFEYSKSTPCTYPFESVVINPEVTDYSNVHSEPPINPLLEQRIGLKYNGHLIHQQQQDRKAKQDLKRKKLVQELQKENKELKRKNQILKHNFKEYQQTSEAKVNTLLNKNYALQSELNEFYEMKKNYKILADQIFNLTKKMAQFMSSTLPQLTSEGIIGELRSQIDIKNKQYECVEFRVKNLKESVERLKQVTTVVKPKQVGELKNTVKEVQEKTLKDLENMAQEILVLQSDMRTMLDKYQNIKKKYNNSMVQREDQKRHISNLELKLQECCTSVSELKYEKCTLNRQIRQFKAIIVQSRNKICDYCGM